MTFETPAWRNAFGIATLLAIGSWALYLPSLDYSFVADDAVYLGVRNSILLDLAPTELWRLFLGPTNPWEYLPIRDLTYWLDARLLGTYGESFHAGNLAWYALCVFAAYRAALATYLIREAADRERCKAMAALAAALFAAHPAHVEAVAWISGRKDILAALFLLLAWAALVDGAARRERGGIAWVAMIFAFFSKGVAVPAAGAMLLFSAVSRRRAFTLLIASSMVGAFAIHAHYGSVLGIRFENAPGIFHSLKRGSQILSGLLSILVLPFDLRVIRDATVVGDWHWVVSAGALAAGGWSIRGVLADRRNIPGWGILWVLLPLAAYLQIMPFGTWSMASERFVFISSFGLSLLLAWALGRLQPRAAAMVAASVVVLCGVLVAQRIPDWGDSAALWEKEAMRAPGYFNSVRPHIQRLIVAQKFDEAAQAIRQVERQEAREILERHLDLSRREQVARQGGTPQATNLCAERMRLVAVIEAEQGKLKGEPNVAYANFLRSVMNDINFGGGFKKICNSTK